MPTRTTTHRSNPSQPVTGPGLLDLLHSYLRSKAAFNGPYNPAGGALWRASSLGYCRARQWLDAKGVSHLHQPDDRSRRTFLIGDEVASALKRAYWHLGVLRIPETPNGEEYAMYDEGLNLGGHVDAIVGGPIGDPPSAEEVGEDSHRFFAFIRERAIQEFGKEIPLIGCEFKTTNSNSWHWADKNKTQVAGDHQLLQAAAYDVLNQRQEKPLPVDDWVIVNVSKDDALMAESRFTTQHRRQVISIAQELQEAYDADIKPACSCFDDWGGKAWKWCPFYQGSDESKQGKHPTPNAGCC